MILIFQLKLQKAHLKIAKDLGDRAAQGRAYGNQGNAFSCMGQYETAIKYHKQELTISREVNDRHAECSTHGNLAVTYQQLKIHDKALQHYTHHLKLSRELRDSAGTIHLWKDAFCHMMFSRKFNNFNNIIWWTLKRLLEYFKKYLLSTDNKNIWQFYHTHFYFCRRNQSIEQFRELFLLSEGLSKCYSLLWTIPYPCTRTWRHSRRESSLS